MSSRVLIDTLESRMFLSVTPLPPVGPGGGLPPIPANPSPVIKADLKVIEADKAKIAADLKTAQMLHMADQKAIDAAYKALASKLQPLQDKLKADMVKDQKAAEVDRAKYAGIFRSDGIAIQADIKAIHVDANNPAKLAADKLKLATDQKKLAADQKALADKLKVDFADVRADQAAIQKVLKSDSAFQAAEDKMKKDEAASQAILKADHDKLQKDTNQLLADLKAGK